MHRLIGMFSLTLVVIGASGAGAVKATIPPLCDLRLSVHLTPDVPSPLDPGFLSSLLENHPGYRLILRREVDETHLELELFGPGPTSQCHKVVQSMRADGRVLEVNVHPHQNS
jgi:hypothetical protein